MKPETYPSQTTGAGKSPAQAIDVLGFVALASYALYACLSWLIAPTLTESDDPNQAAFFETLARSAPDFLQDSLRGHGLFENDVAYYLAYCGPLLVQTACFLAIVWMIRHVGAADRPALARRLTAWGVASACVSVVAFNLQAQDIWLSVVWGRMFLHGINPYDIPITDSVIGTAALSPRMYGYMTYGPVWAGISTAVAFVANGADLLAWFLLKIVLLGAWIASLFCIRAIARKHVPDKEAIAVAMFAFAPVTIHTAVAEGHNDVVMVMFVLAYLLYATDRTAWGPVLLALSALSKYVSAPMAGIDAIYHLRARTMSLGDYVKRALPGLVILAAGAVYIVGGGRLWQTANMTNWRFFEPADLFYFIERVFGLAVPGKTLIFVPVFAAVALWFVVQMWRTPSMATKLEAHLALMAFILYTIVGHCWPWFFIWLVPLVGLTSGRGLRTFVLTTALITPFTMAHWLRSDIPGPGDKLVEKWVPAMLMYAIAAIAMIVALRASKRREAHPGTPIGETPRPEPAG